MLSYRRGSRPLSGPAEVRVAITIATAERVETEQFRSSRSAAVWGDAGG